MAIVIRTNRENVVTRKKEEIVWKTISEAPDYEVSNNGIIRSKDRYIVDKNFVSKLIKGKMMSVQETGYVNITVKDEEENSYQKAVFVPQIVMSVFGNINVSKNSDIIIIDDTLSINKRFGYDNLLHKDFLFKDAEKTSIKGSYIYKIVNRILINQEDYDEETILKASKVNDKYLIEKEDQVPINKNNYYYIKFFGVQQNPMLLKDKEKTDLSRSINKKEKYYSKLKEKNNIEKEPVTENCVKDTLTTEEPVEKVREEIVNDNKIEDNNDSLYRLIQIGDLYIKMELTSIRSVKFYLVEKQKDATVFFKEDPNFKYVLEKTKGLSIEI